jgi:hypothetical protein
MRCPRKNESGPSTVVDGPLGACAPLRGTAIRSSDARALAPTRQVVVMVHVAVNAKRGGHESEAKAARIGESTVMRMTRPSGFP